MDDTTINVEKDTITKTKKEEETDTNNNTATHTTTTSNNIVKSEITQILVKGNFLFLDVWFISWPISQNVWNFPIKILLVHKANISVLNRNFT